MGRAGVLSSSPMLCAPLMAQSVEQMITDMHRAKTQGADVVEVASDLVGELKKTHQTGSKVIVSCYLNRPTPSKEELSRLVGIMQATEADIIKVVSCADNITELETLFHLLLHCQVPIIAYSVGERGIISQILAPKFGGSLVYGSLEGSSIPGLPTLDSLTEAYKVESINSETKVFGLISKPVGHSKGPILHNPTFRRVNYNGIYVPMFVDDLKEFFSVYSSPDYAGFSVGFPYKEAVVKFCDEVHPLAKSIGAANTIVRRPSDGKLIGYNTDCEASITAMEDALKEQGYINSKASPISALTGRQFVLVGAGGAGRALAFGAKSRGARIIIFDVDFVGFHNLQIVDGARRNSTLICAPVIAESVDQMLTQMKKAQELGADLVEIRVDFLKNFSPRQNLEVLIKQSPLPTLITYRPKWEGGEYDGQESKRQEALRLAIELGSDFVDVELKVAQGFFSSIQGKKPEKVKIIVSSHNYESTPSIEEIGELVARIQATGADIVKIATTALDITDNARMFHVLVHSQVPMIGLVMGERGLMSRILTAKYGGFLTFGSIEAGIVSAPGQPTIKDLLDLYNLRLIGSDTKIHGVIGNPIGHSKSPHLYNAAFKSVGFNGIYLPLLVDNVANYISTYSSPDFVGYSYTIPHKEDGLKCCDEVDPIAQAIGAISCMIRRPTDGKLMGYNVDYLGAIGAIEEALRGSNGTPPSVSPLAGKLFVVMGAGGAGKALAYGGYEKGARVVVANRTYEKAKELASKVGGQAMTLAELKDFHPEEGMILANTTSVGMKPRIEDTPLPKEALKHYSLVFDAIYTPKLTRLLREAQECGATIVYGTEMFINQAFVQFERFTGLPAPKQLIRDVLARNT
ncbi:hypothetical protein GH714_003324 [Hevea brasiliensis]|uniref:Uncharacterized protein n=2 Tax=Hevea brasiliensis TaxID=3981 RepID=A0A6A6KHP5_HEVBR|nr:hypothetical protein GH714_003324 [Hevea brasiliensis]